MTRRAVWIVIAINLAVLVGLAIVYPHLMVSPGPLVSGHAELTTDCFACHSPWRGAAAQRCAVCHALPDIGLRTTKGVPIVDRKPKTAFVHQDLVEQDCVACHGDHQGSNLTHRNRKPFSHGLLNPAVQERCVSCHAAPMDKIHRDLKGSCAECHTSQRWKPANFNHTLLAKAVLERCDGCHTAPADALHRQVKASCGQCHSQQRWKPATFDHEKLFVLDRDHDAPCVTCHTGDDYSRYTCYGCHEHTPGNVRAEHLKEGIPNFDNCVECHRSADEEPKRPGPRKGRKRD